MLICGDYFVVPFGEGIYDGAVSVESLHHFTQEEKRGLYAKLFRSLKPGSFFILTDYFALNETEERQHRQTLMALKQKQGLSEKEYYHYDTPLTVEHEIQSLMDGGFAQVQILNNWGATYTLKAVT